jgi:hypothetical protein
MEKLGVKRQFTQRDKGGTDWLVKQLPSELQSPGQPPKKTAQKDTHLTNALDQALRLRD